MVSLQFEVGPMYMLTHRAQACLCNCTGGLKLFRGVSSLPNGGICLPKFFSYQCANWGTIGWNTSSVGDSSRDRVLCSKVGPRITLCDSYCAPNSKLGRVRSDGSLNNFVRAFVGETIAKTAGAVGSGKESAMAEDNVEDTDVRGRKGRVVIIAGPTGVGKSRLALALAKRLRGEIISADSVQVYRTLDVGSAKTPVDEREGIPHHLIDIVDPSQDYTAGYFYDDARAATELVLTKGSVPIVVGGTGMYLRWYMTGKVGAPKATKEVFVAVEEEVDRLIKEGGGWDDALRMLADAGDLTTGPSLARNDWYRLRRALEIIKTSGQPRSAFSKLRNCDPDAATEGASWDYDFHCYFLYQPRSELYQKVDLRCEQMAQEGLLDEASSLLDSGLQPNSNSASRSIGYQLAMEFLMECRQVEGAATEERFFLFLEEFQRHSRK
uniref:tRNA dimethylallyltransferase n=2 Tax=Physcomitrium patens TaxID=3218 RepID=A0A7I4DSN2_PHYPA